MTAVCKNGFIQGHSSLQNIPKGKRSPRHLIFTDDRVWQSPVKKRRFLRPKPTEKEKFPLQVVNVTTNKRKRTQFRTFYYQCERDEFGRLDYNAEFLEVILRKCGRIKALKKIENDAPPIVTSNQFDFKVLLPLDEEFDQKLAFDFARSKLYTNAEKDQNLSHDLPRITFGLKDQHGKDDSIKCLHFDIKDKVINQNIRQDIRRFLTVHFEKEIFSFAETVLARLDNSLAVLRQGYPLRSRNADLKRIEDIHRDILSLLDRKLPEHEELEVATPHTTKSKTSKNLPKSPPCQIGKREKEILASNTKIFKTLGVQGIGNTYEGMTFLIHDPKEEKARNSICSDIRNILSANNIKQSLKTIWLSDMKITKTMRRGDAISTNEKQCTLGTFLRNGTQWKAISAGHAFEQGDIVSFNGKNIGICTKSVQRDNEDKFIDIALIDINPDVNCTTHLINKKGKEIACNACVYDGCEQDLMRVRLHKVGASTGWTDGKLFGYFQDSYPVRSIVVQSNEEVCPGIDPKDPCFADKGDSGAIVFFFDKTDIENKRIKMVSIVSYVNSFKTGPAPEDVPEKVNVAITARLDTSLECLEEDREILAEAFNIT